jgi:hypothetical protein
MNNKINKTFKVDIGKIGIGNHYAKLSGQKKWYEKRG